MLHVTNGDVAAESIRRTGLPGEVLPWRDALHDGPLPAGLDDAALREVRARFLAGAGWTTLEEAMDSLGARDAALARGLEAGPVVLWFEHDVYDQLQLLQVLDRAHRAPLAEVSLIQAAEYLGPLGPARLAELFSARAPLGADTLALAARTWQALRAPDPTGFEALPLREPDLPHLSAARLRLLEEYPGRDDGLARTERQMLAALAARGPIPLEELFRAATHEAEDPVWLGDWSFALYVERLASSASAPAPPEEAPRAGAPPVPPGAAIEPVDGAPLRARPPDAALWSRVVHITPFGAALLTGEADWVRHHGVDRWLGGVHLRGRSVPWRWDAGARRLVSA